MIAEESAYIKNQHKLKNSRQPVSAENIELEDSEIVEMFFQRNEKAIQASQGKYSKYCLTIAANILKNREDAEEIVNEVYLKAWNTIPPNRPQSLATYLGRLTKNSAINLMKMRLAEKRGGGEVSLVFEELEECVPGGSSVEQTFSDGELEREINRFLSKLRSTHRKIFMLRYWYCYSTSDIAARLGITANTVSVTLNRTRKKLKDYLQKRGYEL